MLARGAREGAHKSACVNACRFVGTPTVVLVRKGCFCGGVGGLFVCCGGGGGGGVVCLVVDTNLWWLPPSGGVARAP